MNVNLKHGLYGGVPLLLILSLFSGAAFSAEKSIGTELDASEFDRIEVVALDLEVEIKGQSKAHQIKIENLENNPQLVLEKDGKTLLVRQFRESLPLSRGPAAALTKIKISSPIKDLGISILRGSIALQDWNGESKTTLMHGKMLVNKGGGSLQSSMIKGELHVNDFKGNLNLDAFQSQIFIKGGRGNTDTSLSQGNFQIQDSQGRLSLINNSAQVKVTQYSGNIHFENQKGSMKLSPVQGRVEGKTLAGNVSVDILNDTDVNLETISGKIFVGTKGKAKLNLATNGGEIIVPDGIGVAHLANEKIVRASLGSEGESISHVRVRSESGNIQIK